MDGTVLFKTYGQKDETFELDNWLDWPEKYKDRWPNFEPHEFRCKDGSAFMVVQTELLDALQNLENIFGRERPFPNAPRTLDLDIIFYGDVALDTPRLKVPHPRWRERAFVLKPLAEICPDLVRTQWLEQVSGQDIYRL